MSQIQVYLWIIQEIFGSYVNYVGFFTVNVIEHTAVLSTQAKKCQC